MTHFIWIWALLASWWVAYQIGYGRALKRVESFSQGKSGG